MTPGETNHKLSLKKKVNFRSTVVAKKYAALDCQPVFRISFFCCEGTLKFGIVNLFFALRFWRRNIENWNCQRAELHRVDHFLGNRLEKQIVPPPNLYVQPLAGGVGNTYFENVDFVKIVVSPRQNHYFSCLEPPRITPKLS